MGTLTVCAKFFLSRIGSLLKQKRYVYTLAPNLPANSGVFLRFLLWGGVEGLGL